MTTNVETTKLQDVPIPASRIGLGTWAMGGVQCLATAFITNM